MGPAPTVDGVTGDFCAYESTEALLPKSDIVNAESALIALGLSAAFSAVLIWLISSAHTLLPTLEIDLLPEFSRPRHW